MHFSKHKEKEGKLNNVPISTDDRGGAGGGTGEETGVTFSKPLEVESWITRALDELSSFEGGGGETVLRRFVLSSEFITFVELSVCF